MNFGLVGTGGIAKIAMDKAAKIDEMDVVAIWCHTPENGKKFQQEFGIEKCYSDYDEFLADKDIDIIYVGLPNKCHYSFVKKALESGKNVIVEKPFCTNSKDTKELIKIAKEKNLFLFDGTANQYYENYNVLKRRIQEIGNVKMVLINMSQFSSKYPEYLNGNAYPVFQPEGNGGSLYDLNGINALFVIGLFGKPEHVQYIANYGFNGVDTSGTLIMKYDGFIAECTAAKDSNGPGFIIIQGDKGYIRLFDNPGVLQNIALCLNGEKETIIDEEKADDQRENLFRKIIDIVDRKDYDLTYCKLNETLQMMEVLEEVYEVRRD